MKPNQRLYGILFVTSMMASRLAMADSLGRHPLYLHARSDLRCAQANLKIRLEVHANAHQQRAWGEIEHAIHEIDEAVKFDKKDLNDHPPAHANLTPGGNLRKALELLQSARRDIGREEDNPSAIGWRDVAYRHIDQAISNVKLAAHDQRVDHELGF